MSTVVTVQIDSATGNESVFYSVATPLVPLLEVVANYSMKTGIPMCHLKLLDSNGDEVDLSVHYQPSKLLKFTAVEYFGEWRAIEKNYFKLNQLASSLSISRSGKRNLPIPPEIFSIIFSYLDVSTLLTCAKVCVYWHILVTQASMLRQIELGLFSWHSKLNYPHWLAQMGELSWNIAMSSAEKKRVMRDKWLPLNLHKEVDKSPFHGSRPYQFTKASGCTIVTTVKEIESIDESIKHGYDYYGTRTKSERINFLQSIKSQVKVQMKDKTVLVSSVDTNDKQVFPPRGSVDFVTPAFHQLYQSIAIELYRKYFSTDMYYIFPLMVYKQQQFDLDFAGTETWLIFGEIPETGKIPNSPSTQFWGQHVRLPTDMAYPCGSVSWRFCHPGGIDTGLASIIEVMFIAVWEEERGHQLGSNLVRKLEESAKNNNVSLMYVEIGYEQPKARDFWRKNGFKPARITTLSNLQEDEKYFYITKQQSFMFDSVCLRFADTEQYIKYL